MYYSVLQDATIKLVAIASKKKNGWKDIERKSLI